MKRRNRWHKCARPGLSTQWLLNGGPNNFGITVSVIKDGRRFRIEWSRTHLFGSNVAGWIDRVQKHAPSFEAAKRQAVKYLSPVKFQELKRGSA